jgi:hypothetical protein
MWRNLVSAEWWQSSASSLLKFLKENVVTVIILLATALTLVFYFILKNEKWALAIAQSGIGAALFKAFQVSGIFRKEAKEAFEELVESDSFKSKVSFSMQEVVKTQDFKETIASSVSVGMTTEALGKLDYDKLYDYWNVASRLLYKKKFEPISEKLHQLIHERYLPIKSRFYSSNVDCEIRILKFEDGYFESEEITKSNYHSDSKDKFTIPNSSDYNMDSNNDSGYIQTNVTVYYGTSDKRNKQFYKYDFNETDLSIDTTKFCKKWSREIDLEGSNDYFLIRIVKKRYPFKRNETKNFTFGSIASQVTAVLCMNEELRNKIEVDYVQLGTVNSFISDPVEASTRSNGHICVTYSGLLLPSQGFMFHFKEKK